MNDNLSFAIPKPVSPMTPVFRDDTLNPGVIHARVLYKLELGLLDEALALVRSRPEVVQESTYELLGTHPASRHLFAA